MNKRAPHLLLDLTPASRLREWPLILLAASALVFARPTLAWAQAPAEPALVAGLVSPAPAKPLDQLFASLVAPATATTFAAGDETLFVKIGLAFDPPLKDVRQISVGSCGGPFHDGIEFFTFPGLERFYAEGGLNDATARLTNPLTELRSLTIVLRRNKDACLKSLVLRNGAGRALAFRTALRGTAAAPETSPSVATKTKAAAPEKRRETFAAAGLENVLDQELTPKSEDEHWVFRFRSDGTFFVYGQATSDDFSSARAGNESSREASHFSALGEYTVEPASKTSVSIHLQGERFTTPGPWDGWYCGHSCGARDPASVAQVADPLILEKMPDGSLVIRNRANPVSRSLPLADLPVRAAIF